MSVCVSVRLQCPVYLREIELRRDRVQEVEVDAGVRHYFPRDLVLHHAEEGPVVHHGGLHEPPAEVAVDVHQVLVDRLLQEVLRAFGGRPPPRADGLEPASGGGGDKREVGNEL